MESTPRWFRHFHLFDKERSQVKHLRDLVADQPPPDKARYEQQRVIKIYSGDFNQQVLGMLTSKCIKPTEATFCLLDQRTFECHWSTLEALAGYKDSLGGNAANKIELFYFLPNSWLDRALHAIKDTEQVLRWWGRDDWRILLSMKSMERVERFVERFKKELCYRSVKAWPIREKVGDQGTTMYYMLHATDHPEAPGLMSRAYRQVVQPKETVEQLLMEFKISVPLNPSVINVS